MLKHELLWHDSDQNQAQNRAILAAVLQFLPAKSQASLAALGHIVDAKMSRLKSDHQLETIDRNCDVLPLSLDDLLNYTTLMLNFCTNKPIWALLLRQVFLGGGGRGHFAQKKGVMLHLWATDFREKKNPPQAQYVL